MTDLPPNYHWMPPDQYAKLKFRTRANVAKILSGLRKMYGQQHEVDACEDAIMSLIEDTWQVVRGKDKPLETPKFFRHYDEKYDETYRADD
jgi:hypothetical protein